MKLLPTWYRQRRLVREIHTEDLARAHKLLRFIRKLGENGVSIITGERGECVIKDTWNDHVEGCGGGLAEAIDSLPDYSEENHE